MRQRHYTTLNTMQSFITKLEWYFLLILYFNFGSNKLRPFGSSPDNALKFNERNLGFTRHNIYVQIGLLMRVCDKIKKNSLKYLFSRPWDYCLKWFSTFNCFIFLRWLSLVMGRKPLLQLQETNYVIRQNWCDLVQN